MARRGAAWLGQARHGKARVVLRGMLFPALKLNEAIVPRFEDVEAVRNVNEQADQRRVAWVRQRRQRVGWR